MLYHLQTQTEVQMPCESFSGLHLTLRCRTYMAPRNHLNSIFGKQPSVPTKPSAAETHRAFGGSMLSGQTGSDGAVPEHQGMSFVTGISVD